MDVHEDHGKVTINPDEILGGFCPVCTAATVSEHAPNHVGGRSDADLTTYSCRACSDTVLNVETVNGDVRYTLQIKGQKFGARPGEKVIVDESVLN